jgi:DNA-directed RNA polymerase specialized sigma24 family protein
MKAVVMKEVEKRGLIEILRVPVGTVKAWIRRELVAMRRQLE